MNPGDIDLDALLKRLHLPTIARLYPSYTARAAAECWSHRDLLALPAEAALASALDHAGAAVAPLLERRAYTDALRRLATLREPVDRYFDDVLVMADDERVRSNRLALLAGVRSLFLRIADISRLAID